ncbi:hypothetical protein OIDMADRAFT_178777 [Oidiodendron maius Zn]|uniref:Uncharacterized protein n=1 Tax=Oidiodendron maius (strain Zn) TaxID=913774 RepID=A0A0C3H4D4_OIDMZ|nr:hypothetical protein OIDMADRAFT_178777 [Oidiodendron maius Zn]
MAGTHQDWSNATWDETAVYDLTLKIVNTFLKETFGNWNFLTQQPNSDTIQFWIPRKLTEEEKNNLKARGNRAVQY